jgi:hypothetical protein
LRIYFLVKYCSSCLNRFTNIYISYFLVFQNFWLNGGNKNGLQLQQEECGGDFSFENVRRYVLYPLGTGLPAVTGDNNVWIEAAEYQVSLLEDITLHENLTHLLQHCF